MDAICPKCGKRIDVQARSGRGECSICGHLGAMIDFKPAGADPDKAGLREEIQWEPYLSVKPDKLQYKVVEQRTNPHERGCLKARDLEDIINEYARQGWLLDRLIDRETAASMGIGERDIFLIIFRK